MHSSRETDPPAEHSDLLRQLEEASHSFHWETDAEGLLVKVAPTIETLLGYTPGEVEGKLYFYDLSPEAVREKNKEAAIALFAEKKPFLSLENEVVAKDGSHRWMATMGMPLLSESGDLLGYRGFDRDITEEKQACRRNQFFAQVLTRTDTFVMLTDADQRFEYVNEAFENRTGYSLAEVRGRNPRLLQGPATDPESVRRLREGIASKKPFRQEILNYTKSGERFWVELDISPLFDESGTVTHFVSLGKETTAQKRLEEKLREERHFLGTILETSPTAVTVVDAEGRIRFANSSSASVLGLSRADLAGVAYNDPAWEIEAVEGGEFPEEQLPFARVLGKGETVSRIRHAIRWPDGSRKVLSINGAPLETRDGRVVKGVFTISDVTSETEATRRLTDAFREAEEASLAKSRFLSTISHELRTPLNGILGMSEFLLESTADSDHREALETIRSCGNELLEKVKAIIEVAEGRGPPAKETEADREDGGLIAASEIPATLDSLYRGPAGKKGLEFSVRCNPEIPEDLAVLKNPALRALDHLIRNAIKFTDQGAVEVRIDPVVSKFSPEALRFSIRDTGCGIDPEHAPRIFENFYQADSSDSRRHQGVGLGLGLARRIAVSLGGSLELETNPEPPFRTEFVLTIGGLRRKK
ncbi:MAG: PAS domain S-box protein [Puniceicoccaceae bacterium]